ncbi:MAG: class I mannose-6-phosphate isomerase [Clostridia bacterium]|nr:class I mannose-6-phosphate isomerase [Clostridia bacterium]
MDIKEFLLKTGETRVWRTYGGGAALDRWHGREGKNGMFPEDWAASTTRASNPGREEIVEGLSRVISMEGEPYLADVIAKDPSGFFGAAHFAAFGEKAGFLVKLIDAGERLTIQVHPDKRYAKEILHSDYGKTESWYILGSNHPDIRPCIYLGFKPGVTRETWKDIFDRQDIPAMLDCLHRIPVKAGECYFISAGVPHAIGEGCFLAEIQEPTDYTMRTELVTPAGLRIHENQCHQGVGYEKMLDCFHYDGASLEETVARWRSEPVCVCNDAGGRIDSLIDERQTKLFSMRRIQVNGQLALGAEGCMSILMVLSGSGCIQTEGGVMEIAQGDVLVSRADCPALLIRTEGSMEILQSFPPRT